MSLAIVCPLTTSLSKLGVLCLYFRIFGHISRTYRVVIRATFVLVVGVVLTQIFTSVFNCHPYAWNWNPKGPVICKIPPITLLRFEDLPNLIATFLVATIPILGLVILRPRFSRPVRIGLVVVLSICFCAVFAAVMRFASFFQIRTFDDLSFLQIEPLSWVTAESGLSLLACISMTLRPLLSWAFKDTMTHRLMMSESDSETRATFWSDRSSRGWFKSRKSDCKREKEPSSLSDASAGEVEYVTGELPKGNFDEKC